MGFLDPERPEDHTVHDIGADTGCDPKYMTEHYEINTWLPETEYLELLRC